MAQSIQPKLSFGVGYSYAAQNPTLIDVGAFRSSKFALHTLCYTLQAKFPVKEELTINIGVQLAEKGFKSNNYLPGANSNVTLDYQYSLRYIELPILIEKYFKKQGKRANTNGWSIHSGIILSYLLEANYRLRQVVEFYPQTNRTSYLYTNYSGSRNDQFNRYDVGIRLGFGKSITQDLSINVAMQKHFIKTNIGGFTEMHYNQSFVLGLEYYIK
jgi:hypothetical protein